MERLADVIIIAFAGWHAVEVFHHSDLFAGIRAEVEAWESDGLFMRWLSDLFQCPFCLSLWITLGVTLLYEFTPVWPLVVALAAARGANLLNDLTYKWCRTPGRLPYGFKNYEVSISEEPNGDNEAGV